MEINLPDTFIENEEQGKIWDHAVRIRKHFNALYLKDYGVDMSHPKVCWNSEYDDGLFSLFTTGYSNGFADGSGKVRQQIKNFLFKESRSGN